MIGRILTIASATVLAASAHSAPETYRGVFLETELVTDYKIHREETFLGEETIIIDLAAETIDFQNFEELSIERTYNFNDESAAGSEVDFSTDSAPNDCDAGEPVPCPEPASLTQNYYVIGDPSDDEDGQNKGLFSPNNEFLVAVGGGVERFGQNHVFFADLEARVKAPASLGNANLTGTYRFNVFNTHVIRQANGTSEELFAFDLVDVTFNGDGTCSGTGVANGEAIQNVSWPNFDSRADIRALVDTGANVTTCSYSTDGASGTMTLNLSILDDGETDNISVPFFVSSAYRYLLAQFSSNEVAGGETNVEQAVIVGLKTATGGQNTDISGVYFLSGLNRTLLGSQSSGGQEVDWVSHSVVEFSGAAPDGQGYSACSIVDRTAQGILRDISGNIAAGTDLESVLFDEAVGADLAACRYRVNANGSLDLEFSTDVTNFDTFDYSVSEDQETFVRAGLETSGDPLNPGVEILLTANPTSSATADLTVLQKYTGTANDPAVTDFLTPFVPQPDPSIALAASVLPGSRSVQTFNTATAFATVINAGTVDAEKCDIQIDDRDLDIQYFYQTTDPATNALVGTQNSPINIAAGAAQSFLFGVTPNGTLPPTDIELEFDCDNSSQAASFVGLNTFLLSASNTPVPDVVALGATSPNDGIVRLSPAGAFAVASVNVGATGSMSVSVDTGSATLPLVATICQTDPATSVCINPTTPTTDPVSVTIATNETPTFAVFATATEDIILDPANKRIFVRFSEGGITRGATSVAPQTQ